MRIARPTLLLFLALVAAHADDIQTTTGKKYLNVTISRAEPDGLVVMTDDGIEKIPFTILSKELQVKYGYDPKKAAQFAGAVQSAAVQRGAADGAANLAQEREKQADSARQAKEQEKIEHPVRIAGTIHEITKEGIIVWSRQIAAPVASGLASIGGGGGVGGISDPNGRGRPKSVYGTFFIAGHPDQSKLVDGDPIDVNAYEDGIYVSGSEHVKKYTVIKAFNLK